MPTDTLEVPSFLAAYWERRKLEGRDSDLN
jgi:hypothetical protein